MFTKTKEKFCEISLSIAVKRHITNGAFDDAQNDIVNAMAKSPHDAVPHNLMGILLEHRNNHSLAMKHFRAAWALDPTFRPARFNMNKYGNFGNGRYELDAYEESDCPDENKKREQYKIEYDGCGVGHVVMR